MTAYRRLFDAPREEDLDYLPDPMGRPGLGTYEERQPRFVDPGWEQARQAWMDGAPLKALVGDDPFRLFGSVGKEKPNRRADVFKLQALLHKEGHLDAEATGGPTGYWGNRDDEALRAFQKQNGLTVDGWAGPQGETINAIAAYTRRSPPQGGRLSIARKIRSALRTIC